MRGRHARADDGFTVTEVIAAYVVFSLTVTVLFAFLTAADRMNGRALLMQSAALCAVNEAERLCAHTAEHGAPDGETTEQTQGRRRFTVERRIVGFAGGGSTSLPPGAEEVELTVYTADDGMALARFRCIRLREW